MFTIPNQSSIPKAYTQFTSGSGDDGSRLTPSGNRERLVDCMEGFVKYMIVMRPHFQIFGDRYSEREARREKGKLLRGKESAAEENIEINGVMPIEKTNRVRGKDKINGVQLGSL